MIKEQPQRSIDEPRSGDTAELTTADIAAAVTPANARSDSDSNAGVEPRMSSDHSIEPLFNEAEADDFRARWYSVQASFVDEPRRSVAEADELVASVMKRLAEVFAAARENLEHEWGGGDDVSTEDLRIALRRYHSFFDRLLSV